jgi:Chaperone of endosialidase
LSVGGGITATGSISTSSSLSATGNANISGLVTTSTGVLIGGPSNYSQTALCLMFNTASYSPPPISYTTYGSGGWSANTAGTVILSNNSSSLSGGGYNNTYATCFISNSGTVNYSCWNFYVLNSTDTTAVCYNTIYNGGFAHISDATTKQNIKTLNTQKSLNKILNFRPVSFQYKQRPNDQRIGFISQEVEQLSPLATTVQHHTWTDKKDLSGNTIYDASGNPQQDDVFKLGLNYNDIFIHNVCATQEIYKLVMQQQQLIESLTNRIAALEQK